jgi:LmbE family N-acetylglucosaminyl deacetylase
MVVAPHADDAEYGAAGTVAKWTRAGKEVIYIICTNGAKGTNNPEIKPEQLIEIREKEQRAAAAVLGVRDVIFLGYPDLHLEASPEFVREMVRQIRLYRPKTIVTTDPYRRYVLHRDHRVTGQVVLDVVYPLARNRPAYPELLEEGLKPHKVEELLFWETDNINYRLDITDTFDLKLAALRCHASQLVEFESTGLEERLKSYCRQLAEGEKFEFAEAFHREVVAY